MESEHRTPPLISSLFIFKTKLEATSYEASIYGPRHMGVEIEIERVNRERLGVYLEKDIPLVSGWRYWFLSADPSLRNDGAEFIFKKPLSGIHIENAIKYWYDHVLPNIGTPEFTHRCSIHAHVNVRDFTLDELSLLYGIYILFEDLFFEKAGVSRRGNPFCLTLADQTFYYSDFEDTIMNVTEQHKYFALGLWSVKLHGTVEFRHHPGTKSYQELTSWLRSCQFFVTRIKEHYKELHELVVKLPDKDAYTKIANICLSGFNLKEIENARESLCQSNVFATKALL